MPALLDQRANGLETVGRSFWSYSGRRRFLQFVYRFGSVAQPDDSLHGLLAGDLALGIVATDIRRLAAVDRARDQFIFLACTARIVDKRLADFLAAKRNAQPEQSASCVRRSKVI